MTASMPGFYLHHSNDLERLADRLLDLTDASFTAAGPLQTVDVVVPHLGLARWVQLFMAERHGVSANLRFQLPGSYYWLLARRMATSIPDQDEFNIEAVTWAAFRELPNGGEAAGLAWYVGSGSDDGSRRYQLAAKVARLLSDYQLYRPDWIVQWSSGDDRTPVAHWLPALWRRVEGRLKCAATASTADVFSRLPTLIDGARAEQLPGAMLSFGINHLPAALVHVTASLARRVPVHMLSLSPCQAYWEDLVSERRRLVAALRSDASVAPVKHPLLTSLGAQGQEFLRLMAVAGLDDSLPERFELDYRTGPPSSLLGALQDTLRRGENRGVSVHEADRSIEIIGAYSELREVQALHDRILGAISDHHADGAGEVGPLRPRDIVVVAPAIEQYAPYIRAVFGPQPAGLPGLQFNIIDRPSIDEHPLIRAFVWLLGLTSERVTSNEMLELLGIPALQRRHGLDEDDLAAIGRWLSQTRVHWGLDAAHRADLGASENDAHTFDGALRRLLIGYASGDLGRDLVAGRIRAATEIEGSGALVAGRLAEIVAVLRRWRSTLQRPKTAQRWREALRELIDALFEPAGAERDEQPAIGSINEAISILQVAARHCDDPLPWQVVRAAVQDQLKARHPVQPLMSRGITFANMVPMRSIPARMICVLGLGQGAFPRIRRSEEFDLAARFPRLGDRSLAADDRYLFLETLLAARERLLLSFVSRDPRDDSMRQPSPLIDELIDWARSVAPGRLEIQHQPLHPYQGDLYRPGRSQSHHREWLPAARREGERDRPFFDATMAPVESVPPAHVDLNEIIQFVRAPTAYCLRRFHGIDLHDYHESLDDDFDDSRDGLDAYRIRSELIDRLINSENPDVPPAVDSWWRQGGDLPPGPLADLAIQTELPTALSLAHSHRSALEGAGAATTLFVETEIECAGLPRSLMLAGRIDGWRRNGGLIRYHPGALKGHRVAALVVEYLAANMTHPTPVHYVARDFLLQLPGADADFARRSMSAIVDLYLRGRLAPIGLLPKTSWVAWFGSRIGNARFDGGTEKALSAELDEAANRLVYGSDLQYDMAVAAQAVPLFGILHQAGLRHESL